MARAAISACHCSMLWGGAERRGRSGAGGGRVAALRVVAFSVAVLRVATSSSRTVNGQARRAMTVFCGPLDVMGVHMSGASCDPVRYEYDEADRERISTI